MKKKGLIISTVVMVVVLIASLTTATYAWFTTSNKTSISGFELQVVAGNAMNIGLKSDLGATYSANDAATAFVTGTCTYTGPDAGTLDGGKWEGDPGLGATLDHQILFGEMDKAIGFTSETTATNATPTNTGLIDKSIPGSQSTVEWQKVIKANQGKSKDVLAAQEMASANGNISTSTKGDYAYLWLGVSPAKELNSAAKLHIYIQSTGGGGNIGIAAAVHVAYKVNGAVAWTDKDAFGTKKYTDAQTSVSTTMTVDASDTFSGATKGQAIKGMVDVEIPLTKTAVGDIDQVQLVIYLAGADTDCVDSAKGVSAKIGIYFEAEEKQTEASTTPTAATVSDEGIITMTGVRGATVDYTTDDGSTWNPIAGTWAETTFTASAALPVSAKGATIKVRQTESGKSASAAYQATSNYTT